MTMGLLVLAAGSNTASAESLALLQARPPTARFLDMPEQIEGKVPALLSQTGAFADTHRLKPSASLIPYTVNVPFWSDGAEKRRWIALPNETELQQVVGFRSTGEWDFPRGTVFVKHFELPSGDKRNSKHESTNARRRIETRLLVYNGDDTYGISYRWRKDQSDAELVSVSQRAPMAVKGDSASPVPEWYFPSPKDCATCHTSAAGYVLGVNTRQLNRETTCNNNASENQNQLALWSRLGMFDRRLGEEKVAGLPRLVAVDDDSHSLASRSRSYLDANCAYCHRPGGAPTLLDLRFEIPIERQRLINAPVRINFGIDQARAIAPNDLWRSMVLVRMKTSEPTKMPPLHERPDEAGIALLSQWITGMPGRQVLAPPTITPAGGDFTTEQIVTLAHPDDEVRVHYTLNGAVPTPQSPVYREPLAISRSATVRARAFKSGWKESVTVQETFIMDR